MPVSAESVILTEAPRQLAVLCSHCGLGVSRGDVLHGATEQFCCSGCRTAWRIIRNSGLAAYHRMPERRAQAVAPSDADFSHLDHEAFQRTHVRLDADGVAHATMQLRGVHCASCVWLIERVPLIVPGVQRAVLNVRRHTVEVEWDGRSTSLSQIAGTLASLGYPPQPVAEGAMATARQRDDRTMLIHIAVAGAIAINVMLASLASYSGLSAANDRSLDLLVRWLSFSLTIPAMLWPGRVFFRGAASALRTRTLHLDLPIALALAVGFARGSVNTWRGSGPVYFDALTILIFLLLVGRYIQIRWSRRANDAADLFGAVTPSVVQIIEDDGRVRSTPTAAVRPGSRIRIAAGQIAGADGVVLTGASHVDRAWLTGESVPCAVSAGDMVLAGTRNIDSDIDVLVKAVDRSSHVGRLMDDVQRESEQRPATSTTANRLAGVFIAVVLFAAAATYLYRLAQGDASALDAAIAVLIVTCPCALAMATPLTINVAIGRAAHEGILVRSGDALLVLARRGTLFLDKTGTLTEGRMAVSSWDGEPWAKSLILGLERESVHPVAEAFRRSWPTVAPITAESVLHQAGRGISGRINGTMWHVGSRAFIESVLGRPVSAARPLPAHMTAVFVANNEHVIASAGLTDCVRTDARASVAALQNRGWHVAMLTGDGEGPAMAVAQQTGIPAADVTCLASPEDKLAAVRKARLFGEVVVIGDGVNDTAALTASSAGIAMHGGADVALRCADAYLARPGLYPVVTLMDGAKRTQSTIHALLAASVAYNLAAIALAFSGYISPLMAAILMPVSSVTVVAVAWRANPFRAFA